MQSTTLLTHITTKGDIEISEIKRHALVSICYGGMTVANKAYLFRNESPEILKVFDKNDTNVTKKGAIQADSVDRVMLGENDITNLWKSKLVYNL